MSGFRDKGERDVVIVSAVRTPLGAFNGALSSLTAPDLGGIAIRAAVERSGMQAHAIDEVYFGNVCSAGIGQAPATQAATKAGIPNSVPCTTINKVCASGMKAIMMAAQAIKLGEARAIVAGGMESMSHVPYYLLKARTGLRLGNSEVTDGLIKDGLWDPYNNFHMGSCAEMCAKKYSITRAQQDDHASNSHQRARHASSKGWSSHEIVPISIKGTVIDADEGPSKMDANKLRALRTVFSKESDASVTAGNSSPLSDGAAALVLTSRAQAAQIGLPVIASIKAYADANQAPEWFTTAPSLAIPKAVERAGLTIKDIDYFEINEAFSVVDVANVRLLGLPPDRVNVHGGAVALGHPIGCSGARIVVTLLNVLRQHGGRYGCAAICNGGGGASALVVEMEAGRGARL